VADLAVAPSPAGSRRRAVSLPVLVAAGGVITAVTLGARSTFSLFLDPVITTIGTGRATFALAIAIQNLAWGLSQPFAGALADRFGTARVLSAGAVLYAAGLVLLANTSTPAGLYLSAGLVVGIGTGAASFAVVLSAIGRMAPPAKRSMALGIASAMGSVGQFVLVPLFRRLIEQLTWERSALVLALIVLTVVLGAPFLRGRSADQAVAAGSEPADSPAPVVPPVGLRQELRRAAHSRSYVLLNLGFFVCGFHVTFIGTHLISYAKDIGQTRSVATYAISLIGFFNIAGSLAAGVLGSRYAKRKLLSVIYGSRALVIALFVVAPHTTTAFLVFGAAMGVLWLSTVPLTSGIVASQFGTAHAGTLFGIVFLSHQLGAFVGAYLGGILADRTGSYNPVWWIAVGLGVMAAVVHLLIDEGPQPEPPAAVRLAPRPAFGAAVIVGVLALSGMLAALHSRAVSADASSAASSGAKPADTSDGPDPAAPATAAAFFCPVHLLIGS
jgi:MFS family permease